MQSRIDVSDRAEVTALDFDNIKLLEFRIDDEVRYFEVYENGNNLELKPFIYEFDELDSFASELSELIEEFPPVEEVIDENGFVEYHNFLPNLKIDNYKERLVIENYLTYVKGMSYSIMKENYEISSFELDITMNGNEDEVGEIIQVGYRINCGAMDVNFDRNPLIVNNDSMLGLIHSNEIDDSSNIEYHYYSNLSVNDESVGFSTMILDFSKSDYKPAELFVEIYVYENSVLDVEKIIIGDRMYLFPQKHKSTVDGEVYIEVEVNVYHDNTIIFSFEDVHIHHGG